MFEFGGGLASSSYIGVFELAILHVTCYCTNNDEQGIWMGKRLADSLFATLLLNRLP